MTPTNKTPSVTAVHTRVLDAAANARNITQKLRDMANKTEAAAAVVAGDKELRMDAKAARQGALRANLGSTALEHLEEVHGHLHGLSAEAMKRAMPELPDNAGEAIRQRTTLDQLLQMEQGKQGALLANSQELRTALFSAGTTFDIDRVKANPTVDLEKLREQTAREHSPLLVDAVQAMRSDAADAMKTIGRALASGLTSTKVELAGLAPGHQAGDIARRIQQLPATWKADADAVLQADKALLQSRAQAASGKVGVA